MAAELSQNVRGELTRYLASAGLVERADIELTERLRFRRIVLPQIARTSLPGLVNEMSLLIKVTPVLAVVGVVDITRAAVTP